MSLLNIVVLIAGVAPHPLVAATERLQRLALGEACDAIIRYASDDPGLTDADRERLQLVAETRALDRGDGQVPHRELGATPPTRTEALERARRDRIAAREQAPAVAVLLGAADELYQRGQDEGVKVLLEMAMDLAPLCAADYVQLRLRQGLIVMPNSAEARAAFWDALLVERNASLPGYAEPKTVRLLDSVRAKIPPPITPVHPPASHREDDSWKRGLIISGLTLLASGAAAGMVELRAFNDETAASRENDQVSFDRSLSTARAAEFAANGLIGAGLVTLGAGTLLYLRPSEGLRVSGGAGPNQGTVAIQGSF